MALALVKPLPSVVLAHGRTAPRIAPPLPKRSRIAEFRQAAVIAGWDLLPWQDLVGRYVTATKGGRWLYPEVTVVVARQNGKSTLLIPRIVMGLLRGERIMHTAQNRDLPRLVYDEVANIMEERYPGLLYKRPRRANGQEMIRTLDGGRYRIVASVTAGARGFPNDLVIVDELQELPDFDFMAAARPTLTTSKSPQIIGVATAGEEKSVVLNAIKHRAEVDSELAYLEWSSHPDRPPDDRVGWAEANPALGHISSMASYLETEYRQMPLALFEREHLCRWVVTTAPKVVSDVAWERAGRDTVEPPRKASMGIAVDPTGRRASAAIAWLTGGEVNVRLCAESTGDPIDVDDFARELVPLAKSFGVRQVGFDPWTDKDLERFLSAGSLVTQGVSGAEYAAACERFSASVEAGQLRHDRNELLSGDMAYTVRRETGKHWYATRANPERPTTASFAAIRAVWLATAPKTAVRIY